jgi:hypothetical protein
VLPRVLNLEQFAAEVGGKTTADVQAHIHAGLRSKPKTKTYQRFYDKKLAELQDQRDETYQRYQEALVRGEVVAPPPLSLEDIAKGEGEASEAAKRVLEKRARRLAQPI